MNKSELITHLKQGDDIINKILDAAQLPLDLPDYSPEQVQVIEAIAQLVSSKQSKSYQEAGEVYRKPIREGQLKEITVRCAIPDERIAEILAAMKLKLETLTDPQIERFGKVCVMVQSGMDLTLAAQAVLGEAKAAKTKKPMPEFVAQTADEEAGGGAIALATPTSIAALEVSEADQATLRDMAEALAPEAVPDLAKEMAVAAGEVSGGLKQAAKQIFMDAALKQLKTQNNDPQRAVEMFRKLKRGEAI
jgi:hypothetical protein